MDAVQVEEVNEVTTEEAEVLEEIGEVTGQGIGVEGSREQVEKLRDGGKYTEFGRDLVSTDAFGKKGFDTELSLTGKEGPKDPHDNHHQ